MVVLSVRKNDGRNGNLFVFQFNLHGLDEHKLAGYKHYFDLLKVSDIETKSEVYFTFFVPEKSLNLFEDLLQEINPIEPMQFEEDDHTETVHEAYIDAILFEGGYLISTDQEFSYKMYLAMDNVTFSQAAFNDVRSEMETIKKMLEQGRAAKQEIGKLTVKEKILLNYYLNKIEVLSPISKTIKENVRLTLLCGINSNDAHRFNTLFQIEGNNRSKDNADVSRNSKNINTLLNFIEKFNPIGAHGNYKGEIKKFIQEDLEKLQNEIAAIKE